MSNPWNFVALCAIGLLTFGCEQRQLTKRPLTREEAIREKCPLSLPSTARNVYFAHFRGGIQVEIRLRFEAPPDDCVKHAQTIRDECAASMKWKPETVQLHDFAGEEGDQAFYLGPIPWFDIEHIRHGLTGGGKTSYDPEFWIDKDRGIFYCRIID